MAVGPFSEYEQRFLLSEILKTSNTPINALLGVLREQNFDPIWEEVGLPAGRSVNSCAAELAKLNSSVSGDSNPDITKATSRGIKRTLSASAFYGPATPATKAREIKPKPAAASNGADKPITSTPATGSARKRGRPSNAELAQRAKEASERGEAEKGVHATKRKSISDQSVGEASAPGSEPPAKRGRGRPPKNKAPVANPGGVDVEESKPSEADTDVAAPADPEPEPVVNDTTPQDDAATKETRENLEVVARAASATVSEALAPQPPIAPSNIPAPTSAFKKIFGLGGQTPTTQAPPPEQAIGAAAH
ncbi:hypothetical protein VE00_01061 [Pseudogymnoascus sp. WSF 3629]|nr:hypothetical protein VE00_01061 [Pseudogymnoascus sp. WSF 3629]